MFHSIFPNRFGLECLNGIFVELILIDQISDYFGRGACFDSLTTVRTFICLQAFLAECVAARHQNNWVL